MEGDTLGVNEGDMVIDVVLIENVVDGIAVVYMVCVHGEILG